MHRQAYLATIPRYIVQIAIPLLTLLGSGLSCSAAQRIAIVYSESSAAQYYDRFTYNQLFMAVQNQARMAGIPYDLLNEDDLADITKLLGHQALVIPCMPNVKTAKLAAIEAALDQAVATYQIGLIVGGDLMTLSETGAALANPAARLNRWLGLTPGAAASGVATSLLATAITHPALPDYTASETIVSWPQLWFGSFVPVAGQAATVLATLRGGTTNYNGVVATQTGGRNVHFASEEVMGSTNLLWSCIQWVVYGDQTPVRLNMGRMKSLFTSRTDMDQSMFIDELSLTEVPLNNLLATWKTNYNFVGSFYLNIGNNVAAGETTNWAVSGPLYQNYLSLGNEIGTHSWTHPDSTSLLTATQLEFEFNQSKNTIGTQLGITVVGAAIPGVAESLAVQQQLDNYFGYISGRYGALDNGFPGGIGRLTPGAKSIYWSLTMEPDFSLIEDQKKTPEQAQAIWAAQMAASNKHASLPILQWLWHDYAPTISSNLYTVGLISNTIANAKTAGAEFATLADVTQRIRSFEGATLTVTGTNPIIATTTAQGVGQFSLRLPANQPIAQVTNWYAYDTTQVFLPDNGGTFTIQLGTTPANVTHITELPMRARLHAVTGDGNALAFTFDGEGTAKVTLSPTLAAAFTATGATSYTQTGNQLALVFAGRGMHTATLSAVNPLNQAPVAANKSATTKQPTAVAITLSATDANNDPLTFAIVTAPSFGQLSGTAPNLTYTPNATYFGTDSFTYKANDGQADSNIATVSLTITPANQPPVAANKTATTQQPTAVAVTLSATDPNNDPLTYAIVTAPSSGQLTGTAPNLTYTPNAAFTGTDSFTYKANDGQADSNIATVSLTVTPANQAPVANNKTVTTQQALAVVIVLTATDANNDPLTYAVVTSPASGQLTGTAPNLTYTPSAAFTGTDSFTFRASDGKATSNIATVSITVTPALTMTFTSVAAEDGWVLESTETSNVGGFINATSASGQAIRLGDDDFNRQYKSILSFNTAALPDNAVILAVRLELTRGSTTGTDAFTTHGAARVDIKAIGFNGNKTLQLADYQVAADATDVATFTSQGDIGTVYGINLGATALSKVSLANTTQLRLSLTLDDNNDTESTYVGFHSGGSTATLAPKLIVTYR
jgi:peptidoglycan/xylan/chitin deacetylase (PgdA/CDA1 family)/diacylglycerol kinase family enzyme